MKKIFYLSFLLSFTMGFSKVITVNNNVNAIGMYSNLQSAINDALVDDTVMVHSSPTSYGNIAINKRIVLIGEGFLTSTDLKAKKTTIGDVNMDSISGGPFVSGIIIEGFDCSNIGSNYGVFLVNDVIIKNCKGYSFFSRGNGWQVINCAIVNYVGVRVPSGNFVTRFEIHNSILGYFTSFNGGLIANCVFTHQYGVRDCKFIQVQNCIFDNTSTTIGTDNIAIINSSFTNTPVFLPENSNSCSNCFFGTAPRFINKIDYQLDTSGSPNILLGAGSDGDDIGITGGTYPITKLDGRINLPQVSQVVVKTGVIAPGENLIIEITGRNRK